MSVSVRERWGERKKREREREREKETCMAKHALPQSPGTPDRQVSTWNRAESS